MKPRVWAKAKIKSETELKNKLDEFFQPRIAEFFYSFFDKEIEITSIDYNQHGNAFWVESIEYCFYDWMFVPGSFRLLIDEEQIENMYEKIEDYCERSLECIKKYEWKNFIYKPEPEVKSKVEEFKENYILSGRITVEEQERYEKALEIIQQLEEENKRLKNEKTSNY